MRVYYVLVIALALSGCLMQALGGAPVLKVQKGYNVTVDYVGTLDDGTVFDTSIKAEKGGLPVRPSYEPLEFTVGSGQLIKGFDEGVLNMTENETKTIRIPPAEAYGERHNQLVGTVPRTQFNAEPKVGARVQASNGQPGVITKVDGDNVTVDFNHPLAGQTLNFKIIVRKITRPQPT